MPETRPTISTHVLDLEHGHPAVGVPVSLHRQTDGVEERVAEARTDGDGRVARLVEELIPGSYRLTFDVAAWLSTHDRQPPFFSELSVRLAVRDASRSYHIPLLLAPFGMTTYRGT